jgi:hypothetical protein
VFPLLKGPKKYVPSAKQRASDEKLGDELRHFDLKKFDKALEKVLTSDFSSLKFMSPDSISKGQLVCAFLRMRERTLAELRR